MAEKIEMGAWLFFTFIGVALFIGFALYHLLYENKNR